MDISIVIPLLNEEESLQELAEWIDNVMNSNHFSYEIILLLMMVAGIKSLNILRELGYFK